MSKHTVIVNIISLLIFESVRCQNPPPIKCPDVFSYQFDRNNNSWYGVVVARNPASLGSEVLLKVTLSSDEVMSGGRLELSRDLLNEKLVSNEPLEYKVVFPENSPFPYVDLIEFNNNVICTGITFHKNMLTLSSRIRTTKNPSAIPVRPVNNNIYNQPTGSRYADTTRAPYVGNECGLSSTRTGIVALIYGGKDTQQGDWPWTVAIFYKKTRNLEVNGMCINFLCGGSLISKDKVLTAAHCVYVGTQIRPKEEFLLKFGAHDLRDWTEDTQSRNVKSIRVESGYDAVALQNDIAILTTTRDVEFNIYIRPVCLWTSSYEQEFLNQLNSTVVGWGLDSNGNLLLDQQKEVIMPIVSNDMCRGSKVDFHSITSDTTLCAGGRDGSGPCQGDSGGGLYVQIQNKWYVRGIVSKALEGSGVKRCDLNQYAIFTDVAKYRLWINQNK